MARLTASNRKNTQTKRFLRLNGTNTAVSFASYVPPITAFSLAVWWKPQLVAATNARLMDWQDAGPLNGFTLNIATASKAHVTFVANNGAGASLASIKTTDVEQAEWHLIILTYEVNSAKLFVDSVQQGVTDTSVTITAPATGFQIGRRADAAANFGKGSIREFMVFPRVLTTAEITALYTGIIPASPDVYLKMDELSGTTLADSSGNGRVGTVAGVAQYGMEVEERSGIAPYTKAVNFPLISSIVAVSDAPIIRPETTRNFTWMCRVNIRSLRNNVLPRLIEKGSHYTAIMGDQTNASANYMALEIENVDTSATEFWGTTPIPTQRWVHLATTFDDATCQHYIDGQPDPMRLIGAAYVNMSDSSAANLNFANRTAGSRNLDGIMQDVRIYNVALTADEVYRASRGENITRGLVGQWKMNEGSGTAIVDSINGNDGVLTDGVWQTITTARTSASRINV